MAAVYLRTVYSRAGHTREQAPFEAVAQGADAVCTRRASIGATVCSRAAGQVRGRQFGGFSQRDDAGDVLGSGAAVALVVAAMQNRLETRPGANEKGAHTLGSV